MRKVRTRILAHAAASNGSQAVQASPRQTKRPEMTLKAIAQKLVGGPSGKVPSGDVRMTANIRSDLHIKLKIAAAERRTTIGELIEELVEHNL